MESVLLALHLTALRMSDIIELRKQIIMMGAVKPRPILEVGPIYRALLLKSKYRENLSIADDQSIDP
jgi:hypothetical protein